MYKLHLILKYLRKRRIAWVSLLAVMLCTSMVLIVISVMGGWLRMFKESFHGLSGDVIVEGRSLAGFPHYEEMIGKIKALPEVKAAVPTIHTYGLINIKNVIRQGVQVIAYPLEEIGEVNRFPESLYLQHQQPKEQGKTPGKPNFALRDDIDYQTIVPNAREPRKWPGMIVGDGVVGIRKGKDGMIYRPPEVYEAWAKLTVLGISGDSAALDLESAKAERNYWIVDDSRTQIWQYDSNTVYVPFDVLQRDLGMDAYGGQPARTSEIHVATKPGVDLNVARSKIEAIVRGVLSERKVGYGFPVDVQTWEESQAMWIDAIEHEKLLVVFLFAIISVVAIFLIFCIFYMVVAEKTRDIGIIKSVGATNAGVAGIFLGYGLAIGIVGAGLGLLASYLIISNINEIHTWLGQPHNWFGIKFSIVIWKPEVYAFETIPNTMNPTEVAVILTIAVLSSVIGALIPAIRAARLNPVESLRWE